MGNTLGDGRKNRTNHHHHHHHHRSQQTHENDEHDDDEQQQQHHGDCCVICLEPTKTTTATTTTTTTTTTCHHTFHTACLAAWSRQKDTCPLCRHRLAHYNGTLSEIIQPNAHGNTCYRFTFPTPSLKYYFFDNIYNFVAAD